MGDKAKNRLFRQGISSEKLICRKPRGKKGDSMSSVGKLTSYPVYDRKWNRLEDKFGNNWDVKSSYVKDTDPGENLAFRLDFSDPKRMYPQAIPTDDD